MVFISVSVIQFATHRQGGILDHFYHNFISCYSIFSFMCMFCRCCLYFCTFYFCHCAVCSSICFVDVVCPFVLLIVAIVLSVLRYIYSVYPFGYLQTLLISINMSSDTLSTYYTDHLMLSVSIPLTDFQQ